MPMVAMVKPTQLGSVSIHKGAWGVDGLHIVFMGQWPYVFVFVMCIGQCVWGFHGLRSPNGTKKPTW